MSWQKGQLTFIYGAEAMRGQWENTTGEVVCAVRGTPCWHTSRVLSEEPKPEEAQTGMPKDISSAQPFPRLKHLKLHLNVQVLHQRCQVLTLVNLQPVTTPQHPSPPAFQREVWELLLCRRRCYQRHWEWGEPHGPPWMSELAFPFTTDIFWKL